MQHETSAPFSGSQKLITRLRRFWWVPAITLALGIAGAVAVVLFLPPTFVSQASMWETEKLRLPDGALFSEDPPNYLGTEAELLKSGQLLLAALNRIQNSGTNAVRKDKDGQPLGIDITASLVPKSSVLVISASSSDPSYVQKFLDALLNEYLQYKRNVRKVVSGDTLASISVQVERFNFDLKAAKNALTEFQRSNNLALLQEEGAIAGSYLARLKTQLADYQLELKLLLAIALEQENEGGAATLFTPIGSGVGSSMPPRRPLFTPIAGITSAPKTNSSGSPLEAIALEQEFKGETTTNSIGPALELLSGAVFRVPDAITAERQAAIKELTLLKFQREKLEKSLGPQDPAIAKIDEQMECANRLMDLYRTQWREQLETARRVLKIRIESVQSSMRQWETNVANFNARNAEAERLKQEVARNQALYDRLVSLLQNIDISRNIDLPSLAVLQGASPARRSFRKEIAVSGLGIIGGLAVGIIGALALAIRGGRAAAPKLGPVEDIKARRDDEGVVEALRKLKLLHEQNSIGKEVYEQKVKEIVDSI